MESPSSLDIQEIQFKLHDKFNVFPFGNELRSHVNLLAAASNQGLLFVGNPYAAELKVFILNEIVDAKTTERKLSARSVQLFDVPNSIAVSADGNMLAVNCTQNGNDILHIYSVASFLTVNPKLFYNLRLSAEENVSVLQLLWNPVLTSSLAVVLRNGALSMYTLKDGGTFEFHTLDKQNQVKCGCWSPKGKQIVLGFPNGKLQQFKPDLTPAKNIICPVGIHPGPFDVIAIHWLSTFQFAAVFLQHGQDMSPSLYIVNAPKGGQPSYINYYDICYSATGPRQHQINFTHVQQWNLLLMTSANGVEIGILGTKETGESPTWVQYALLDEARIEMPLTDSKDETYPIGFAYDTSSSHQLTFGEQKIPVMPMVHVLSTHGHLVSFNFLNLTPGAPDVCSPPPPIIDASGQFKPIEEELVAGSADTGGGDFSNNAAAVPLASTTNQEMSFAFNPSAATSTPALKDKPKNFFGGTSDAQGGSVFGQNPTAAFAVQQNLGANTGNATGFGSFNAAKPQASSALSAPTVTPTFGGFGGASSGFSGFEAKAVEPQKQSTQVTQKQIEMNKPLFTVPPTFTPATTAAQKQPQQKTFNEQLTAQSQMTSNEVDDIVRQMIAIQINSFDVELKQLDNQSKNLLGNIGKPDEMKLCTKRLNDLQEIIEQANDRDFELDVQQLRHSLNESYAMLAECRTKLDMFNNPDLTRLTCISTFDPLNRRQLAKLQSNVTANQAQLQQLQHQIDGQWASYQDLVRRNSKTQMHIPCLDGIYQRMTKLKDMMARQRTKLNYVKSKLKQKGLIFKSLNDLDTQITEKTGTMESLADSILSMSLANTVDANHSKLSAEKLNAIRGFVRGRHIVRIRPQRPDRVGLKSEVILETKLQTERQSREGAVTRLSKMQQEKVQSQANAPVAVISKPTATKPTTSSKSNFIPPAVSQAATSPNLGFGGNNSLFVKTSSAAPAAGLREAEPTKSFVGIHGGAASMGQSSFVSPSFAGFGASNQPINFGQTNPAFTSNDMFAVTSVTPIAPISFAAKVVTSDTSKLSLTAANSPSSFLPTKPAQDKENKNPPETEIPKTFSFSVGVQEGTAPFGVGGDSKAAFGVAPASGTGNVSLFGSLSSNANKNPTFDGKQGSNAFSFGGIGAAIGTAPSSMSFTSTVTSSAVSFGGAGDAKPGQQPIALTTSSTSSATPDSTTSIPKSPVFSGFGKSVGESNATTTSSSFSFNALNWTTPPTATTTTSSIVKATSASTAESAESTTNYATASSDSAAADSLFSLNICKPASNETDSTKATNASNVFSGFGGNGGSNLFSFTSTASDVSKPLFGGTTSVSSGAFSATAITTTTPASSSNATAENKISDVITSAPSGTVAVVKPVISSTPTPFSFSFGATTITSTPSIATTSAVAATAVSTSTFFSAAVSSAPIFATIAPTSTTSTSIFGGNTASFLGTSTAPTPTVTAAAMFGTTAAVTTGTLTTAAPSSIFGAAAAATAASPSMFGTTVTASSNSTNVFGGIPKPDQSVFGSPPPNAQTATVGGIFATAAAANQSPFSSPPGGGSIFGGGGAATGFGTPSAAGGSSIFGGGGSANSSPFVAPAANTGSIFGGAAKPVEGANIFGSPTQPAVTAGGSIFGQNTFAQPVAQSTGSIFSGGGANTQQPSAGFGGGSIFGGGTAAASNTIFGGATSAFGASSPGFGSFSQQAAAPAFSSQNAGAGSFAQGGASVAQSGFGSPPQNSAFSKPLFGGTATFGSPPAFGAQPSFGGAATFGSPKGFGSFASPTSAAAPAAGGFASPTQKNNLFEALGSTETGLSFGNLAQNTNVNVPKPTFGGSSFMNYRA